MIQGIETVKAVKDLSQTGYKKNIYALDQYGFINVLCVDDFSRHLYSLGLSSNYIDLIANIIHSNLVYGLAKKIGVMPGLFKASDNALKEYLQSRVSDAVEASHKGQVVTDLIAAWNHVATHPEAEKQHMFSGQTKDSLIKTSDFTRFVYYKPFVESIFEMVLSTWSKKTAKQFVIFYIQFVELFYSPLSAKALYFNQFTNAALLKDKMKEQVRFARLDAHQKREFIDGLRAEAIEFDEDNFQYSAHPDIFAEKLRHHPMGKYYIFVSEYLSYIREECRTHIGGWASLELCGLGEKYSAALLHPALLKLLEGDVPVSPNHELRSDLEVLVQKIANPQGHDAQLIAQAFKTSHPVFTEIVDSQKVSLTHQALLDAVLEFVADNQITLQYAFPWPESFRCLAVSEEEIVAQLLQCLAVEHERADKVLSEKEAQFLRPEILFAIQQTATSADTQDIILSIIQRYLQEQKDKVDFAHSYPPVSHRRIFGSINGSVVGSAVGRSLCPMYINPEPLIAAGRMGLEDEMPRRSHASASRVELDDDERHVTDVGLSDILGSFRVGRSVLPVPLLYSSSGIAATMVCRKIELALKVEPYELVLKAIQGSWKPVSLEQDAETELAESLDQLSLGERSQRPKSWFSW